MNGSSEKIETLELPALKVIGRQGTDIMTVAGAAKHWHTEYKKAHTRGLVRGLTVGTAIWFGFQIAVKLYGVYHGF